MKNSRYVPGMHDLALDILADENTQTNVKSLLLPFFLILINYKISLF